MLSLCGIMVVVDIVNRVVKLGRHTHLFSPPTRITQYLEGILSVSVGVLIRVNHELDAAFNTVLIMTLRNSVEDGVDDFINPVFSNIYNGINKAMLHVLIVGINFCSCYCMSCIALLYNCIDYLLDERTSGSTSVTAATFSSISAKKANCSRACANICSCSSAILYCSSSSRLLTLSFS